MKISETSVNLLKCTYSEQRTALLAEVSALAVAVIFFLRFTSFLHQICCFGYMPQHSILLLATKYFLRRQTEMDNNSLKSPWIIIPTNIENNSLSQISIYLQTYQKHNMKATVVCVICIVKPFLSWTAPKTSNSLSRSSISSKYLLFISAIFFSLSSINVFISFAWNSMKLENS